MDENLYRIGEANLVYYHLYDENEYLGYFMIHLEDFLEMLIDDFLDDLMNQN